MVMELYNEEHKRLFLDSKENKEITKDVYSRIFKKSFSREELVEKDLYNFDENELKSFISEELDPKTKESARTYCTVLSAYIQWAIDKNLSRHITNPIRRRQDFFFSFIQDRKLYMNVEEKDYIIKRLLNKQDGFILQALWEGVQGTRVSELTQLRISDVNEDTNTAQLRNQQGHVARSVQVTDRFVELAFLANIEPEYYKRNGEVDFSDKVKDVARLPKESDYVLKSTITNARGGKIEAKQVSHYTVYNRLEMIKSLEQFQEYVDALDTKNIVRSGMIHMAYELLKRDKELGKKQLDEICERYNMKYKWSLRDFLNEETVKRLYPDVQS